MDKVPVLVCTKGKVCWYLKDVGGNEFDGWDYRCFWSKRWKDSYVIREAGIPLSSHELRVWYANLFEIKEELIRQGRFERKQIGVELKDIC